MMDENKGMMMEQMMSMMSNWKDQDAELDKLVAEMNNARRQETRRCRGRFDQNGRTAQGAARADAEDDGVKRDRHDENVRAHDERHENGRRPREPGRHGT